MPFQSLPIALCSSESGPCAAMMRCWSSQYAIAAMRSTKPYSADGALAKWFSLIHAVVKGNSDSQNSR